MLSSVRIESAIDYAVASVIAGIGAMVQSVISASESEAMRLHAERSDRKFMDLSEGAANEIASITVYIHLKILKVTNRHITVKIDKISADLDILACYVNCCGDEVNQLALAGGCFICAFVNDGTFRGDRFCNGSISLIISESKCGQAKKHKGSEDKCKYFSP